jgi:hypothetical protein
MLTNFKESNLKILYTSDYSQFRMINGNRELNAAKIKRIQKDIAAGLDVLRYCPILVTKDSEKFKIVDGQHHFWVAKELKKPVFFVVVEKEIDLHGIAKINSNTETWKNKDYINCYAQQGNEHYLKIQQFMDKWQMSFSLCLRLLSYGLGGEGGTDAAEAFKSGRWTVKKEKEATELASLCKLFDKFPEWRSAAFVTAISKVMQGGKCDIAALLKKFEKNPEMLTRQTNYKDYLTNLENIYNKYNEIRKVIY